MAWTGPWIGSWAGLWLGGAEPEGMMFDCAATVFGRIRYGQGALFHDPWWPCSVSDGAILARSVLDDYVRLPLPDTRCPNLSQSAGTMDGASVDLSEPSRWEWTVADPDSLDTTSGWSASWASPGTGITFLRLAYYCYPEDFQVEFETSYIGRYGSSASTSVGFGLVLSGSSTCFVGVGASYGSSTASPYAIYADPSQVSGAPLTGSFPVVVQVRRIGSSLSCRFHAGSGWTDWMDVGSLLGPVRIGFGAVRSVDDGGTHAGVLHRITTVSGGPSALTVTTPPTYIGADVVVDAIVTVPSMPVEFRYGQTRASCLDAPWQSGSLPSSGYPYWQVRVTVTDPDVLVDRIELVTRPLTVDASLVRGHGLYWGVGSWSVSYFGETIEVPYSMLAGVCEGLDASTVVPIDALSEQITDTDRDRCARFWISAPKTIGSGFTVGPAADSTGRYIGHIASRLAAPLTRALVPYFGLTEGSADASVLTEIASVVRSAISNIAGIVVEDVSVGLVSGRLFVRVIVRAFGRLQTLRFGIFGNRVVLL